MSRSGLLFALFCLGVVALYFLSARAAWSPFADGGRTGSYWFYGGRGATGPQHK